MVFWTGYQGQNGNLELFDPLLYGVYVSTVDEPSQLTELSLGPPQPCPHVLQI